MDNQKHLFSLPSDIHYLNGAYMSPSLKTVEAAGIQGLMRKSDPSSIKEADFFEPIKEVRQLFGRLINAPADQIALIPSVSYGLMNAMQNIPCTAGQYAITVSEEFPSDYLTLRDWCQKHGSSLNIINPPAIKKGRTKAWTDQILAAISEKSAVLVMSSIHWMDGTLFDLEAIGQKCKATNTYFIVDGTQSVGALPMDVHKFHIDALICAAYKWLLGPYSSGLAYYSEKFNEGKPIELSWMTRKGADDFSQLTKYPEDFGPGAMRYHVGELSNFIALPMLQAALEQILAWQPAEIQKYCGQLLVPVEEFLNEKKIEMESFNCIAAHLCGVHLPDRTNQAGLMEAFKNQKVLVSARGNSVRLSPHVYNTKEDIDVFIKILDQFI